MSVGPLVRCVPPCCFKQCVLPSNRRRVSPTAGAQRYQQQRVRGKRLGSSIETNQLLCAALVTLPAPALPRVSPIFKLDIYFLFYCGALYDFPCVASFQEQVISLKTAAAFSSTPFPSGKTRRKHRYASHRSALTSSSLSLNDKDALNL